MSYQTEEQQVEQLKEWWKDNGTPLIVGAVLGLSGFFGWKFYNEKQIAYQIAASDLYITVTEELEKDDKTQLIENANTVKVNFPDTSYAILAAFQLAKIAVEKNDLDSAASEFNWIITNHSNNELASTAKIRLARVLIAQQKTEEALPLLAFDADSGYFEVASLIKGDALIALEKTAEALEAYKAADNIGKATANHPTLKLNIEELTADAISGVQEKTIEEANNEANIESQTNEQLTSIQEKGSADSVKESKQEAVK